LTQYDYRRYALSQPYPGVRLTTLSTSVGRVLLSDLVHTSANPRLNLAIAEAVLGMWPSDIFDSFGLPRSRWLTTLSQTHADQNLSAGSLNQPPTSPFDVIDAVPLREPHKVTRRF